MLTIEELLASPAVKRLVINTHFAMKFPNPEKWDEERLRMWCESRGDRIADHYIYGYLTIEELDSLLDLAFHPPVNVTPKSS